MRFFNRLRDDQIVKRVLKGRRDEFAILVDRYGSLLEAVAFSQVGNHSEAEDVVQTAFMKAFASLHTLRDQRQFGPWITTIARNEGKQYQRKSASAHAIERRMGVETGADDPGVEERDMRELLRRRVMELDETPREVLLMHYFSGKSTREIAAVLGVSQGAVKKRLERARTALSERLTDELGEILGPKKPERERKAQVMAAIGGIPAPWLVAPATSGGSALASVWGGTAIMSTSKILAVVVSVLVIAGAIVIYRTSDNRQVPKPGGASEQNVDSALQQVSATSDENAESVLASDTDPESTPPPAATPEIVQGIVGHVRDKDTEAGIAGVEIVVKVAGDRDSDGTSASTDAAGVYQLPDLAPGKYEISRGDTPAPYREPTFADRPTTIEVEVNTVHKVDFTVAKEAPFSGIVVDSDGKPVSAARVVLGGGTDIYIGTRTTTDEEGRFRFRGLSPTGGLFIIARKDDRVSAPTKFELPPSGKDNMVITIVSGAFIAGTVVDPSNNPLGDIRVISEAIPSSRVGAADPGITDAKGEFTIGPLAAGAYRLVVRPKGEMPNIAMDEGERFEVTAGERRTGVVLTYNRFGTISGTITNESGEPIPEARVSTGGAEEARTDANGAYTLSSLSPGLYLLQVYASGYIQTMMHGVAAGSDHADFVLKKSAYNVAGRVVDANSGSAIPAFEVTWFPFDPYKTTGATPMMSAGNLYRWNSYQDDQGRFALDINWYVNWTTRAALAARAPGYGTAFEVIDLNQPPTGGVLLKLQPGGRLEGTVTTENGTPVRDVMVFFQRSLPGYTDRAAAVSDAQGQFAIDNFPQEDQQLAFYHPEYSTVVETVPASRERSQPLHIVLIGGGTVRGVILAGETPRDWQISVSRPGENTNVAEGRAESGKPFTLSHVAPGEGTLNAYARGENFRTVSVSCPIVVNAGQTVDLELDVPSGDAVLQGQIALGQRLPETLLISVEYQLDGFELKHMALGRSDGSYELQGLPSGPATVEVEARMQDGQVFTNAGAVTLESGQTIQSDFVLPE